MTASLLLAVFHVTASLVLVVLQVTAYLVLVVLQMAAYLVLAVLQLTASVVLVVLQVTAYLEPDDSASALVLLGSLRRTKSCATLQTISTSDHQRLE